MSNEHIVELIGVRKHYHPAQPPAVDDLSLTVYRGEVLCLLGPSGCGKTTTLRLIAGFETPDTGTVLIDNQVVAGPNRWTAPEKRGLGVVFQEYALFPHYTVEQNVAFGLHKFPRRERAGRVAEVLDLVGLGTMAKRYPHELSGGQQQRVALARALAPKPVVVLLDEPFSNLDADLRVQMRLEIRRILHESGSTAIFVTHDQQDAMATRDAWSRWTRRSASSTRPRRASRRTFWALLISFPASRRRGALKPRLASSSSPRQAGWGARLR
jgi:iron(III) transport system ATP-binding protein